MPYKIVYDRTGCIGCGTCAAVDSDDFQMASDGLADLVDGEETSDGVWEKEIPEERKEEAVAAASGCPVNVIKVIDTETGEKLAP